jgi:hypothetical protein
MSNIDVIETAGTSCLPPHSSHKIQPFDVAFINPFEMYHAQGTEIWLQAPEGRVITHCQVAAVLEKTSARSAIDVAVNRFQKIEIFPFQPSVFRDHDFATKTTDVDIDSGLRVQKEL